MPNSGSSDAENYQNFYNKYFNNQQIAFSYKTTQGWISISLNYIQAEDSIIDAIDIALVPAGSCQPAQVPLAWSETSIAAIKGLAPQIGSQDGGQVPTVINTAVFDRTTRAFSAPQTISWIGGAGIGIGVSDLSISSAPIVYANGTLSQQPLLAWSQPVAVPYAQAVLDSSPSTYLQMNQGQSGVSDENLGTIAASPTVLTSASSTGLLFNVSGALGVNSDAAIVNSDGTGVLSTWMGRISNFQPATSPTGGSSAGQPRDPYTIEFWAPVPEGGNPEGAGLFALGQPSGAAVGPAELPEGWLLTSSFVVDQLTWTQALGRGLISSDSVPTGTDPSAEWGYAWAVLADGANTTALGGNGGKNLYDHALSITNLQAGSSLAGVDVFLQSYDLSAADLTPTAGASGIRGSAPNQIAEVPLTSLHFSTALRDGAPNSSLDTIAVSTTQAVISVGTIALGSAAWNANSSALQTLFGNLWDYQQKTGKAKVNFDLAPAASAAAASPPPLARPESYGGYALDFTLSASTAVSVNGQGQVVFDVGSGTSLLSTLAAAGSTPLRIDDGDWHYIVATYLPDYQTSQGANGKPTDVPLGTGTASLYIDNQLVGRMSLSDVFSPDSEASDALLLYLNTGGAIDELALYQQALTVIDPSQVTPPSGDWPALTGAEALDLLTGLGIDFGALSKQPGVASGAATLHWNARAVDPNGAVKASFTSTYDASSGSWSQADVLKPAAAPQATQLSGSLSEVDLLLINPSDWQSAKVNPLGKQLQSVTVNLLSSSDPSTILRTTSLDCSQVLIGDQTLLSRQPRASSDNLAYTFLNGAPSLGLLVPSSKLGDTAQLYSHSIVLKDPATQEISTFSSAQLNPAGIDAVLPLSGPRLALTDDPAALLSNPAAPSVIATADVLEQAPVQLQYINSGEVIRSQQDPASTRKGFGLSQVAGRYSSSLSGFAGTQAGWLAISQPFTPTAQSNPAGRVWIQYTVLYPANPGSGNPPVEKSPSTWLNALARSSFSADAPNLPLLQNSRSQSSSGGLLIAADPTEGWGGNLGQVMLVADINGDGCDELIIAAPDSNNGGSVYIISGSWIQQNLNSNPQILDLNNPDPAAVTVLTANLAGPDPSGCDFSNAQFGSALAFDGTSLYIGAPTYRAQLESGVAANTVSVGAVFRYGPASACAAPALSLFQPGTGGSLISLNPVGEPVTSYWGERLGTSLAATRADGSGSPYGDGALLKAQLLAPTAGTLNSGLIDITAGSGGYTPIANQGQVSAHADEASGAMQRLKALMTDPIATATTYFDASLTANEVGAVYLTAIEASSGAATPQAQAVFYGTSPWNTGSTGFGSRASRTSPTATATRWWWEPTRPAAPVPPISSIPPSCPRPPCRPPAPARVSISPIWPPASPSTARTATTTSAAAW